MIFGWGELRIGTAATGSARRELAARASRGRSAAASGSISPSAPTDASRWPAASTGARIAGLQSYERLELRGPGLRGPVTGEVDAAENARASRSRARRPTSRRATPCSCSVRRALGNPEAQPAGFTGAGSFRGRWRGTLAWPVFEGRFSGDATSATSGVDWGRAEWSGSFDTAAEAVESHSLVLRKDGGEIWWDGTQRDRLARPARRDRRAGCGSARGRSRTSSASWSGASSRPGARAGRRACGGRRSAPEGEARIVVRDGRYFAVPYESARIDSRWNARRRRGHLGRARASAAAT